MCDAFNGDSSVGDEIIKLRDIFHVQVMIETGTSSGHTTRYLSSIAKTVHSIEINNNIFEITRRQLAKEKYNNVLLHLGNSAVILESILANIEIIEPILFYLDAQSHDHSPVLDEIAIIGKYAKNKAIIVIDDFQVPNSSLGYITFGGIGLNYDLIKPSLNSVYDKYCYYYNKTAVGGYPRGKIYIYPCGEKEIIPGSIIVDSNEMCYYVIDKSKLYYDSGHCFHASIFENRSKLLLFEDGVQMGAEDSQHEDIRNLGLGRYSHWYTGIYFSSTDNTDVRHNNREYKYYFAKN
ncbi:MAG: hypothetical protein Harvfovirus40_7 [Harvfovirus sp.]|uniref:Uncharacterized protein n=1 Tax=Harvfovirus sp. TaxID=2487768 RepID=A0A3G5A4X5_9VIRU|nr:MAG: hypothetical protein Harvfovirus40_7 [Harvfovirus sp.]